EIGRAEAIIARSSVNAGSQSSVAVIEPNSRRAIAPRRIIEAEVLPAVRSAGIRAEVTPDRTGLHQCQQRLWRTNRDIHWPRGAAITAGVCTDCAQRVQADQWAVQRR